MTRTANRRTAALVAVLALVAAPLAIAAPASAHSFIVASSPAEGSTVTELPPQFSITANELLLDLTGDANGFAIQVVDAATTYYGDGCAVVSGSTLSMGATLGQPGDYRMFWQVISADGHVVAGEIPFTWAPPEGTEATPGLAAPPVCGVSAEEPTPTATPEPEEPVSPEPVTTEEPVAAEPASDGGPLVWIIGIGVGLAVVVVIVLVARGRRTDDPEEPEDPDSRVE